MSVESGLSIGFQGIGTFDRPTNSHLNQLISVGRASIDVRGGVRLVSRPPLAIKANSVAFNRLGESRSDIEFHLVRSLFLPAFSRTTTRDSRFARIANG